VPSHESDRTDVTVDCAAAIGPLERVWAAFGYDELNWTATPRGKRNLARLRDVLGAGTTVRAHNIYTSGSGRAVPHWSSGNVYHEDDSGNPFYDWRLVDEAFDAWVDSGLRPIVELGFCPFALARDLPGPDFVSMPPLYGRYEVDLWASPPKDLSRWGALVAETARHFAERYGRSEVSRWYWELWNEPDIAYWQGTLEEYCALYDVTAAAVKSMLPDAPVGGPATTGGGRDFLRGFLEHCADVGAPVDFVSFHTKGAPGFPRLYTPVGPHGAGGGTKQSPSSAKMLAEIEGSLDIVRSFPALADVPVLVDECDPGVPAHYGVFDNPDYAFRNTAYYPVFQLQMTKRLLDFDSPRRRGITGATAWAWYLEGDRYFEGTRSFFTAGDLAAPVVNGYRMLDRLGATRLAVESAGSGPGEVGGLASVAADGRVAVIVWRHDDDQYRTDAAQVSVTVTNLPTAGRAVTISRRGLDADTSNTHTLWLQEGAPQDPTDAQLARIRVGEELAELAPARKEVECPAELSFTFRLPMPGAVLIEISPS
jgi:xylan 1,4-beta-xylosidase